jgi:peptidoglycan/LPS O-acetylase OafA/YrhL
MKMQSKRNFGLDFLRAAAITGVFFAHGVTAMEKLSIGVDLFFVLSGFLIGRIYFRMHRDGDFKLGKFWLSRWWRTLPPYFAALGLFALVEQWIPTNPVSWYYILFLQTFIGLKGFGPSWSLCVEEHFYLALPLLALGVERIFGRKQLNWVLPTAFFIPLILRAASISFVGGVAHMPDQWYRLTPFHSDGLIAGVYLAYLYVERPGLFKKADRPAWICAPLVLVAMLASSYFSGRMLFETLNATILAMGFAAWLRLAYTFSWTPTSLAGRVVEWTVRSAALASYSIYLLHVLIMSDLHVIFGNWPRSAAKTLVILSVTLAVCILFYLAIERPTILTRDKFLARSKEKSKRRPASPFENADLPPVSIDPIESQCPAK